MIANLPFRTARLMAALGLLLAGAPAAAEEPGTCSGVFRTQTQGGCGADA